MPTTRIPAKATGLLAFALLLLVARTLFVLAALDPAEERVLEVLGEGGYTWPAGPERPLYDREELYGGAAALAMAERLPIPLSTYRFMAYGAGSLIVSVLAVPLFLLCGPSYLVWKLLPILIGVGGGVAWFAVVRQWFGARAAWGFGLLYLFAPSTFLRTTLIAKGDHGEAAALVGLVLLLATQAHHAQARRWAMACGAALGFGIFFSYSVVPATFSVLLAALALSRAKPWPLWRAGLTGLAVGLLPWIASTVATNGATLRVYGSSIVQASSPQAMATRLAALINQGLFAGFDLPGGILVRQAAAMVWLSLVVLGIASTLRLRRDAERGLPSLLLVAGILGALLAFVLRAPDASSRYLAPAYPLLLVAVALHVGTTKRPLRLWAALTLGICAQGAVFANSTWTAARNPLKGYDRDLLGEVAGQKLSPERISRLDARLRGSFARGFGKRVYHEVSPGDWSAAARLVGADSLAAWEGVGLGFAESGKPYELASALGQRPMQERRALRRGFLRAAEVVWIPMHEQLGIGGLQQARNAFAAADRPDIDFSIARSCVALSLHDARTGLRAVQPAFNDVAAMLDRRALARAAGEVSYRSGGGIGGPHRHPAPSGSWVREAEALDPPAFLSGLADGLERELAARVPASLLRRGGTGASLWIPAWIGTEGADRPGCERAMLATGHAIRDALLDPAIDLSVQDAASASGIRDGSCREAYLRGLTGDGDWRDANLEP